MNCPSHLIVFYLQHSLLLQLLSHACIYMSYIYIMLSDRIIALATPSKNGAGVAVLLVTVRTCTYNIYII
jgi:hypothetical protein